MGLRTTIEKSVQTAIKAVGDIAETITYNSITDGTYDTYTGLVSSTTTDYTIKAIVSPVGGKEESNITSTSFTGDVLAIFASKDLTVTPDTNDTVTRNAEIYNIHDILSDPVTASYTLTLTRAG